MPNSHHRSDQHSSRKTKQAGDAERKPAQEQAGSDEAPPAAEGSPSEYSHGESTKTDQQDHITADRQ